MFHVIFCPLNRSTVNMCLLHVLLLSFVFMIHFFLLSSLCSNVIFCLFYVPILSYDLFMFHCNCILCLLHVPLLSYVFFLYHCVLLPWRWLVQYLEFSLIYQLFFSMMCVLPIILLLYACLFCLLFSHLIWCSARVLQPPPSPLFPALMCVTLFHGGRLLELFQ